MHDFTFAIVLYECVVLRVEFRALDMISKCCSMNKLHTQCFASELEEDSRKGYELCSPFYSPVLWKIWPVCLLRHKPSFEMNGYFLCSSIMPHSKGRASFLPGGLQCCPLMPLNSFKSGLQI